MMLVSRAARVIRERGAISGYNVASRMDKTHSLNGFS